MADGATLKLPPVTVHWLRGPWEVDPPVTLARWLTEFAARFPYDVFWAKLAAVDLWQDERTDAPQPLRSGGPDGGRLAGYTMTAPLLRVHLSAQYDVRAVLAHELGHCAQHWAKVLPAGHPEADSAGVMMWGIWRSLPDGDGEEDFASRFGRQLTGTPDLFMRDFPLVLNRWRARVGYVGSPHYYGSGFTWWDGGYGRWERCENSFIQYWSGSAWVEV